MGRMDRVAESAPPRLRRARPRVVDTSGEIARDGAAAAVVPSRLEWGIAIAALFLLQRFPVLFLRMRLVSFLGPVRWPDWQYDAYVRATFFAVELVVVVAAARAVRPKKLLRHPFLIAFLVMTWASTIWSVEPGVTIWRSLTFIGAAAVGVYVGERFTSRDIATIVASVGAIGAAASLVAIVVVPKIAKTTSGTLPEWSGVYVNRNILGLVLALGILASAFLLTFVNRRARIPIGGTIVVETLLLWKTGNRTGPMALAGALGVSIVVYAIRRWGKGKLQAFWASVLSLGTLLIGLGAVEWQWGRIVSVAGRTITLSHRTVIWAVDRAFIAAHPWTGWGFEAIWTNRLSVAEAVRVYGRFPYEAHSGYYEVAIGVGWVGLVLLGLFLAVTLYRAFVYAWRGRDVLSLWPLAVVFFILAANFTESLFVSSEAFWALIVAIAFALSRTTTILVRRSNL